jgi:ribosomal protein L37E
VQYGKSTESFPVQYYDSGDLFDGSAGFHISEQDKAKCLKCGIGTYNSRDSSDSECEYCPDDTLSNSNSTDAIKCPLEFPASSPRSGSYVCG